MKLNNFMNPDVDAIFAGKCNEMEKSDVVL